MSDSYNNEALTSHEQEDIEVVRETGEHVLNISVKEALRSRGAEAELVILKELSQMLDKKVWTFLTYRIQEKHELSVHR